MAALLTVYFHDQECFILSQELQFHLHAFIPMASSKFNLLSYTSTSKCHDTVNQSQHMNLGRTEIFYPFQEQKRKSKKRQGKKAPRESGNCTEFPALGTWIINTQPPQETLLRTQTARKSRQLTPGFNQDPLLQTLTWSLVMNCWVFKTQKASCLALCHFNCNLCIFFRSNAFIYAPLIRILFEKKKPIFKCPLSISRLRQRSPLIIYFSLPSKTLISKRTFNLKRLGLSPSGDGSSWQVWGSFLADGLKY